MSRVLRRVPIELAIDAELIEKARDAHVDLATAAAAGISQAVVECTNVPFDRAKWIHENRAAFESLRLYVEENGFPSSEYRQYPWPASTST